MYRGYRENFVSMCYPKSLLFEIHIFLGYNKVMPSGRNSLPRSSIKNGKCDIGTFKYSRHLDFISNMIQHIEMRLICNETFSVAPWLFKMSRPSECVLVIIIDKCFILRIVYIALYIYIFPTIAIYTCTRKFSKTGSNRSCTIFKVTRLIVNGQQ